MGLIWCWIIYFESSRNQIYQLNCWNNLVSANLLFWSDFNLWRFGTSWSNIGTKVYYDYTFWSLEPIFETFLYHKLVGLLLQYWKLFENFRTYKFFSPMELATLLSWIGLWNEIDFRACKATRLMGLEIHWGGVKLANSLKWWSAVASYARLAWPTQHSMTTMNLVFDGLTPLLEHVNSSMREFGWLYTVVSNSLFSPHKLTQTLSIGVWSKDFMHALSRSPFSPLSWSSIPRLCGCAFKFGF